MVSIQANVVFGQERTHKLSNPIVLSEKALSRFPALEENIFYVQFYCSREVKMQKPLGKDDAVLNGKLIINNKNYSVPYLTKAKVIFISTDKDVIRISVDYGDPENTALELTKNRRGVYKLSGVGKDNPCFISKGKGKMKLLFDPSTSKENVTKLPGDEVEVDTKVKKK